MPLETSRCRELLWLPLAGFYTVWLPSVLKWLRSSFQTPIMHNAFKYIIQAVFCVHIYSYRWCLVRQFAQGREVKWLSVNIIRPASLLVPSPALNTYGQKGSAFPGGIQQISSCFPSLPSRSLLWRGGVPASFRGAGGSCTLSGRCLDSASRSAELPGLSQSQAETLGSPEHCTSGP